MVLGFSPDGTRLAVVRDPAPQESDAETRLEIRRVSTGELEKAVSVGDLAAEKPSTFIVMLPREVFIHDFAPDGRLVAIGVREENTLAIFDTTAWTRTATLSQQEIRSCRFFPDSRTLLLDGLAEIRLWDAVTGRPIFTAPADDHAEERRLWISPEGRELTAVERVESWEDDGTPIRWRVRRWEIPGRRQVKELSWPDPGSGGWGGFEIASDGRSMACVNANGGGEIREINSGTLVTAMPFTTPEDNFIHGRSADGRFVVFKVEDQASGDDGKALVWDTQQATRWPVSVTLRYPDLPISVAPQGSLLATIVHRTRSVNGWIEYLPNPIRSAAVRLFGNPRFLWLGYRVDVRDMESRRLLAVGTGDRPACGVQFSPDASALAISDMQGGVILYNVPSGRTQRRVGP